MLPQSLSIRPHALLLDAGDTLLFVDYAAFAAALFAQGVQVEVRVLERSMQVAKRAYQAAVARNQRHEDGWTILVRAWLIDAGIAAESAAQLLAPLRAIHDECYFWRKLPDELPAALAKARRAGLRLAVVSNSEGKIESMLERAGVRDAFEFVVDSHIEGVSKPNPEIFRRALSRLGIPAGQAVYAGDLPEVDLEGARAAGMHGVLVDAFDHYADRPELPRVRSVAQLIDELLALPTPR
jgi:HAD superfamily hydrolase (TIGR01662 family)